MYSKEPLFITKPNANNHFVIMLKKPVLFHLSLLYFMLCYMIILPTVDCRPVKTVVLTVEPIEAVNVRRVPYKPFLSKRKFYFPSPPPSSSPDYSYEPSFSEHDSFPIVPDDALTEHKYSQPELRRTSRRDYPPLIHAQAPKNHKEVYVPALHTSFFYKDTVPSLEFNPSGDTESLSMSSSNETDMTTDLNISEVIHSSDLFSHDREAEISNASLNTHIIQNNFTATNDSQVVDPSNTVLTYHLPPPSIFMNDHSKNQSFNITVYRDTNFSHNGDDNPMLYDNDEIQNDSPDVTVTYVDSPHDLGTADRDGNRSLNKVSFTTESERDIEETVVPASENVKQYRFSSGVVAGIVIAVLVCVTIITSSVIYLLYRRYNGQCTGVVESKFNSDNCGYLDDSLRSSIYLNNHIELPKENSEEMTSLDNDSFLNSLETMTIQNYWADNTKNTKV